MSNSNAIVAKAKAKFGQFLNENDYNSMLKCNSVSEVVGYLKNNTHYKKALSKVNEHEIHRAQAEQILKQNMFEDLSSLCRYETGISSSFSSYIIEDYEINLILHCIILINSGSFDTHYFNIPAYFAAKICLNVDALSKAKTFDDLIEAIANTKYAKILEKYKPYKNGQIDVVKIENELINDNYTEFIDNVKSQKDRKNKDEILKYFNRIIDYFNYVRIYRLIKYYHYPPQKIKEMLIPYGTMNKSRIDTLCSADDYKDLQAKAKQMPIGRAIERLDYVYPGEINQRGKFALSYRNMYQSTNASVVLISFMFISQIELSNVITLIEGARYNVKEENLRKILIY